ncbi:MAG: helix-hairpin-helix domain-containing protein [Chthoniobacterales bacterium]|jgi:DNA uptake protein ComE-like DNA-binding protein
MKLGGAILLLFPVALAMAVPVEEMQTFKGCRYIATEWADGDSFTVELEPGRREVVRLYFADCPETSAAQESDQRRVREQSAHFGVEDPKTTMEYGRRAAEETARILAQSFSVHTSMSPALGRSAHRRIYAFITTANGRDLGEWLVENGLARSYGVGRTTPGGLAVDDAKAKMDDLELLAAVRRAGLWSKMDQSKLAALREERREEVRSLESEFALRPGQILDVNDASVAEIELLPGVGPLLAERIVDGRPYKSLEDLRRVPGIGDKMFARIKDLLKLTP